MDVLAFFRSAEAEPYLHGTRHVFEPGQILEGGAARSNQGMGTPGQHVYFTRLHDVAKEFADAAYGPDHDLDARPRVYQVEPLDRVEDDPDEDPEVQSFRSRRVRVVREASKQQEVDDVLGMLGVPKGIHVPGRVHTLAEETGEATHVPTPSRDAPQRKGYFPGEDLTGIDKGPYVGWVKTEHLLPLREYDRAGKDANPDSRETINGIRRSMRTNGMTDPVILAHDHETDRAYLCEGNHRLQAAVEEGWPAVPVHVVRAYKSEARKMGWHNYLGSWKVRPDASGYTPGSLHPQDALPDHMLHTGDAGLRPKTAAIWEHPEPEFQAPPEGLSDEERIAHAEPQFQARRDWRSETRKALSRGDLTNEQAIANGYHGIGHDHGEDTVFGPRTLGWKPLPHDLYHTTTDVKGVLTHGLKTRDELRQQSGAGLGGGESDTISFTDDRQMAGHILNALHEFHDVVNLKKTPAHMWDEAQQGDGAGRPFHEALRKAYQNHPGGLDAVLRGEHHSFKGGFEGDEHVQGMTPVEHGDHIETAPGKVFHTMWKRPMTDEEKRDSAVGFYKQFAAHREWAGGRPDPGFFSSDIEGFRHMDPDNFGIVHARPKPGAKGYQVHALGEWRTATGDAVDIVHHQKTAGVNDDYEFTHEFTDYNPDDWDAEIEPGQTPIRDHHIWAHPKNDPSADYAGYLNWNDHDRFIGDVGVQPEHQRKGIATEMLRRAREITPDLRHSTQLTPDSEAWSRKVGRWLPHDRIFSPGHGGVDPRLFDEKKRMRPEIANVILGDLDAYWHKTYPDWRDWCRVYLAGSEASEWYGNNDFDTLLGVDHKKIRAAHPEFADMLDEDIDAYLTTGLRENLNNEDWIAPWDGQVWHRTYYVNPNSWDIRAIKPYAAYDITRNRWVVEPVHPTSDWGPEKLPASYWDEMDSIIAQVHAIEEMPEPMRSGRAAALWDYLHSDRRRAFGPTGTGVYDPGNAVWKALDMHPDHPLSILIDLKKHYLDQQAARATA